MTYQFRPKMQITSALVAGVVVAGLGFVFRSEIDWTTTVAVALGVFIGMGFTRKGEDGASTQKERTGKDKNLNALREALLSKNEVTNDEVQDLLGVSHATATRYLDELEKEGLIEQQGDIGRGVAYTVR